MVNRLTIPRLGVPNLPLRQLGRVGMFWWFWYVFQEVFFMIICIHVSCIHLSSIVGPQEKTTAESHRIQTTLGVDSVPAAPPFRQVFCQRLKGLNLEEGKHWHYVDAEDFRPKGGAVVWVLIGWSRKALGVAIWGSEHLGVDTSELMKFDGYHHFRRVSKGYPHKYLLYDILSENDEYCKTNGWETTLRWKCWKIGIHVAEKSHRHLMEQHGARLFGHRTPKHIQVCWRLLDFCSYSPINMILPQLYHSKFHVCCSFPATFGGVLSHGGTPMP